MLIVLFASAMCLAMLIATGLMLHEEAERARAKSNVETANPFAIRQSAGRRY